MKKILNAIVLVLAVNFLAVVGGVTYAYLSGMVDGPKLAAIRDIVLPKSPETEVIATQPSTQPTTLPASRLDDLLAKYSGRRAGEQVELIQQSVDAQAAALDRRTRELDDLMGQILREKEDLAHKTTALETDRQRLADQEKSQVSLATDKGFQDSLKLYTAMPAKQTKSAFMTMPDDAVARFLQTMPPRTASKILKEFKTPEEQTRINRVLEQMRQGGAATKPSAT